ncbi:probable transcription factor At1g61730 [Malania oleifera]|uniref:probable transcription factor At1g61730 n=1 Tax=Malania oleifera TaxID=397392 RepID=UPI0025AE10D5|nr:probable transcription factor At1g61730 [Malania oleifera]
MAPASSYSSSYSSSSFSSRASQSREPVEKLMMSQGKSAKEAVQSDSSSASEKFCSVSESSSRARTVDRPLQLSHNNIPVPPVQGKIQGAAHETRKTVTTGKRLAEGESERKKELSSKKTKRVKIVVNDDDAEGKVGNESSPADSKKVPFLRIWSDEDEIAVLEGMLGYKTQKGVLPSSNMNSFLIFIKKSLRLHVSKNQLSDKVRRLRKKYRNNAGKRKSGSTPHEKISFELSKKIWGDEGARDITPVVKVERQPHGNRHPSCFPGSSSTAWKALNERGIGEDLIKLAIHSIGAAKVAELQEKWKRFDIDEIEMLLKRLDLIKEKAEEILEIMRSRI